MCVSPGNAATKLSGVNSAGHKVDFPTFFFSHKLTRVGFFSSRTNTRRLSAL